MLVIETLVYALIGAYVMPKLEGYRDVPVPPDVPGDLVDEEDGEGNDEGAGVAPLRAEDPLREEDDAVPPMVIAMQRSSEPRMLDSRNSSRNRRHHGRSGAALRCKEKLRRSMRRFKRCMCG